MDNGMQLSDRVRELREKKGHTQKSLAAAAGITVGHVSKVEGGHENVLLKTIKALSEALETSIDALVYGTGPDKSAQLKAIEDEQLELGRRPDSEAVRNRLRELSARAAELSSDGVKYPPLPPTSDGRPRKRRGPARGSKRKRLR